jgi:hypothetical protein
VFSNGYIEEEFVDVIARSRDDHEIQILHSGLIYLHERNPRPLFQAIASLKGQGFFSSRKVRCILRAAGHEDVYSKWLKELNIDSVVELAPAIPYRDAIQEMFDVDGLLLMQGAGCNQQIPAKAYEYLRTRKPLLALTDRVGDTAALLIENGVRNIVPLDQELEIGEKFVEFIGEIERSDPATATFQKIKSYSRMDISRRWVAHLSSIIVNLP